MSILDKIPPPEKDEFELGPPSEDASFNFPEPKPGMWDKTVEGFKRFDGKARAIGEFLLDPIEMADTTLSLGTGALAWVPSYLGSFTKYAEGPMANALKPASEDQLRDTFSGIPNSGNKPPKETYTVVEPQNTSDERVDALAKEYMSNGVSPEIAKVLAQKKVRDPEGLKTKEVSPERMRELVEDRRDKIAQALTLEPKTEAGAEITKAVGDFIHTAVTKPVERAMEFYFPNSPNAQYAGGFLGELFIFHYLGKAGRDASKKVRGTKAKFDKAHKDLMGDKFATKQKIAELDRKIKEARDAMVIDLNEPVNLMEPKRETRVKFRKPKEKVKEWNRQKGKLKKRLQDIEAAKAKNIELGLQEYAMNPKQYEGILDRLIQRFKKKVDDGMDPHEAMVSLAKEKGYKDLPALVDEARAWTKLDIDEPMAVSKKKRREAEEFLNEQMEDPETVESVFLEQREGSAKDYQPKQEAPSADPNIIREQAEARRSANQPKAENVDIPVDTSRPEVMRYQEKINKAREQARQRRVEIDLVPEHTKKDVMQIAREAKADPDIDWIKIGDQWIKAEKGAIAKAGRAWSDYQKTKDKPKKSMETEPTPEPESKVELPKQAIDPLRPEDTKIKTGPELFDPNNPEHRKRVLDQTDYPEDYKQIMDNVIQDPESNMAKSDQFKALQEKAGFNVLDDLSDLLKSSETKFHSFLGISPEAGRVLRKMLSRENKARGKGDGSIFSQVLRTTYWRGQRTSPRFDKEHGKWYIERDGERRYFDTPTADNVIMTKTRNYGEPGYKGEGAEARGVSLTLDPRISERFSKQTLETPEIKRIKKEIEQTANAWNKAKFSKAGTEAELAKLNQHLSMLNDKLTAAGGWAKTFTRVVPLYGDKPESVILYVGNPTHRKILADAYKKAVARTVKEKQVEEIKSYEELKKTVDPDTFNRALTNELESQGWKGIIHTPHRYNEFELQMFDPKNVLFVEEPRTMQDPAVKRLMDRERRVPDDIIDLVGEDSIDLSTLFPDESPGRRKILDAWMDHNDDIGLTKENSALGNIYKEKVDFKAISDLLKSDPNAFGSNLGNLKLFQKIEEMARAKGVKIRDLLISQGVGKAKAIKTEREIENLLGKYKSETGEPVSAYGFDRWKNGSEIIKNKDNPKPSVSQKMFDIIFDGTKGLKAEGNIKSIINRFTPSPWALEKYFGKEGEILIEGQLRHASAAIVMEREMLGQRLKRVLKGLKQKEKMEAGAYAISVQERGMEILERMGVNKPPKWEDLSPKQQKAYQEIRQIFDELGPRLNEARESAGLKPVRMLEDYFPFMIDVIDLDGVGKIKLKDLSPLTSDLNPQEALAFKEAPLTKPKFFKRRTGKAHSVETDIAKIADMYVNKAVHYIHMTPTVAQLNQLLGRFTHKHTPRLKPEDGVWSIAKHSREAHRRLAELLEQVSLNRDKSTGSAKVDKVLQTLNMNVVSAVMGASVRTFLIQPLQMLNSVSYLDTKSMVMGARDLFSEGVWENTIANSKQLQLRRPTFDAAITDLGGIGTWKKIQRGSLQHIAVTDFLAAFMTARAAYHFVKDRFPDMKSYEIWERVDAIVEKTQGSGARYSRAPIQQSVAGKTLTLFQTFVIAQANLLARDIFGAPFKKGISTGERLRNSTRIIKWLAGTAALNHLYEDRIGISSPIPDVLGALYDEYQETGGIDDASDLWQNVKAGSVEFLTFLPIMSSIKYGSSPAGALLDKLHGALGPERTDIITEIIEADDPKEAFERILMNPQSHAFLTLYPGMPGWNQIRKSYRQYEEGGDFINIITGENPEMWENRSRKDPFASAF